MRVLLGAFGDPGHAFPMLALGKRLAERGHVVCLQTWIKWRADVEAAGMTFAAAPEYQVFPTLGRPMRPYEAATAAARDTEPLVRDFRPDACVADILTLAPAWAAELWDVPVATLIPHVCPLPAPGFPPYSLGARLPRTRAGARVWGLMDPLVTKGLVTGRDDYNAARGRLGLPPKTELHTGLSRSLTLVGTLPQLEYPRPWPAWMRVVGPLMWEPPGELVAPPPGSGPVVLVAPSTAHDAEHALLRAALDGLAGSPDDVRVIATWNGRRPPWLDGYEVPPNAVLVPWLSYGRTMPACDVVISHGGHGTLVRALTEGCAVVVCPAAGDMGENAARADWAGAGVRLPKRLLCGATVRLAVQRALGDPALRSRAVDIAAWSAAHDAATAACEELERWAPFPRPRAADSVSR
jgi:UDP:flavonoid glycosyltransferase YjiC (YdhE family)